MSLPLGQGEIFPKIGEFDVLNISRQKQAADITSVRDKLEVKVVEGIRDRSLRTQCEPGAETAVVREPCSSGQPQLLRTTSYFIKGTTTLWLSAIWEMMTGV